jgi:hypothetical protein
MERLVALAADEEQAVVRTVLNAGLPTARAGLVGLVGVHSDTLRSGQRGLVREASCAVLPHARVRRRT